MKKEIIVSGYGGQGVMSIGKTLAEAGVREGLEVTWVPSYGPEMRGGSAKCSVVLSEKKVGAPVFDYFNELIAMNETALKKYLPYLTTGGNLFINSDIVTEKVEKADVNIYYIPCDMIAEKLGNKKAANMVMLGAYANVTKTLKMETLQEMVCHIFSRKKSLIDLNLEALEKGACCAGLS